MNILNRFNAIQEIVNKNTNIESSVDFITIKLIEEMAELTQAIIKYDIDQDAVLEELADVYITFNEFLTKIDSDRLDKMIDYKILRTLKRLGLIEEEVEENFSGYANRE